MLESGKFRIFDHVIQFTFPVHPASSIKNDTKRAVAVINVSGYITGVG
jgi:hypothetical protein